MPIANLTVFLDEDMETEEDGVDDDESEDETSSSEEAEDESEVDSGTDEDDDDMDSQVSELRAKLKAELGDAAIASDEVRVYHWTSKYPKLSGPFTLDACWAAAAALRKSMGIRGQCAG